MLLRKTLNLTDCNIKMDAADLGRFTGYASVFGGVDSYGDTILSGAFKAALRQNPKPKMFYGHDSFGIPIGKWLTVTEDDKGLLVDGELTPGVSKAQDVLAALKHGTLDGLSIGGYLKPTDFEIRDDGTRIIRKWSKLVEISVVTFPADLSARIDIDSVKSAVEGLQSMQDFEHFLRDAGGFSTEAAKMLISHAKTLLNLRDASQQNQQQAKQDETQLAALALRLRSIRLPD